ncbi:aminotransferase class IV [Nocardioides limicola]|uniref:aminotransferase class IV n=1 Tax=Nocardioides limicola TaxID=2803368 RepID=UPI00193BB06C|nr:aminotransferase class IV [Nocardioides sp. DJM-14]
MRVWIDGQLLPDPQDAAVTVSDHGLTVGDGVFETLKVLDGVPFALSRHLDRLDRSAAGLGLESPDHAQVRDAVSAVLNGTEWPLGRLRITLTGGPAPMGSGRGDAAPTLIVVAGPMEPQPPTTAVVTVPWTRNERSAVAGLKTTSYAENVVALARATAAGASEAILANTVGNLCEGTGTNIFYAVDGELRTPSLATGCLAGITRELVLDWHGAVEAEDPASVLDEADEVFLTSSTRDVQAVVRIDDRRLDGPGELTRAVQESWVRHCADTLDP